ncbi:hypothetical protein GCM10010309_78550 [Streptomyces violaceochromogenes]|nr:hypothetical protein GCM10010309_78550 [Streptomyces violaceochromogenes]
MSDRRPRGLRAFTPGKPPVKRSAAGAAPERPGPDARTVRPERPERDSSVITAALCEDGRRTSTQDSLMETFRELRRHPGGMAWIGLYRQDPAELQSLAAEFDLHPLAVEDALEAHQRPKLERYGDTLFVVLRAARYMDAAEEVDFGELHVFAPGVSRRIYELSREVVDFQRALSLRLAADGRGVRRPVRRLQAPRLAVTRRNPTPATGGRPR